MNFFKKLFSKKKPKSRFKQRSFNKNLHMLILDIYNKKELSEVDRSTISDGLSALNNLTKRSKPAENQARIRQALNMLNLVLKKMALRNNNSIFLDKK